MAQYLRVKRRNQTIFLYCEPTDKIVGLKERLCNILSLGLSTSDMRIISTDKTTQLPDESLVADAKLQNGHIIYLICRKAVNSEEEWESLDFANIS